jgi:hypothetical protein
MAISAPIGFIAFMMQIIREFIHSNDAHSRKDPNGKNRALIFLVKSSQMNEVRTLKTLLCVTFRTKNSNFRVLRVSWLNHAKRNTKKQFSSEDFT